MVDFSALLKKPAGQAKKPEAFPADTYPGIIKAWEVGDANKNKTPYVRFHVVLTGEGTSTTLEDLKEKHIDITKRTFRRDFYLTEDAEWRLDEFLRSMGIDVDSGRPYEETIPECVGKAVQVEIQQYLNATSNEIGNQIGGLVGAQ
jgi:hypothetical protein